MPRGNKSGWPEDGVILRRISWYRDDPQVKCVHTDPVKADDIKL